MSFTGDSLLAALPRVLQESLSRLRSSSLGDRFAHGVFWSLGGSLGSRGATLISSILVARLLGPAAFGEYSVVQSTVGTVLVLASLGLGLTATKFVAELRKADPARASRMIALCGTIGLIAGGLIALVLVVFAPTIAARVLAAPQLASALRVGALMVVFGTLVSMQAGALAGFEAFDTIARINLALAPIGLIAVVAGAYWAGVMGAVTGLALSQLITWFVNRRALLRRSSGLAELHFVWPTARERRELYSYSAPTVLTSLVIAFTNWAAVAALVNTHDGYRQMGIFGAANQWLVALLVIPTIIGQVVFPHATRVVKEGFRQSSKVLRQTTMISAAVSLPIVLVGCLLSPIMMGAYGSGFRDSSATLIVVLLTAGLMAVQTPAVYIIAAAGRMWWLLGTYLIWAAVFLGVSVFAVQWGALGLASCRLAAYTVHSLAILVTANAALRRGETTQLSFDALPSP